MGYKSGDAPMLILFLVPPLVCAYAGGLGPGLVATAVGALVTDYFLLSSLSALSLRAGLQAPQWIMLVLIGTLLSVLLETLRKSGQRYRAILESSLDAIVVVNQGGFIEEFNPAAEHMFGHTAATVLGRELAEVLVPPTLRAEHRAGMARYFTRGKSRLLGHRMEMTALHADGTEFPIEVSIQRSGTASPPRYTGFIRDITERKQAEAKLAANERHLRAIIDNEPECVKLMSADGKLLEMNPAGLRMIEADSFAQVANRSVYPLIAEEYRKAFRELNENIFRGEPGKLIFPLIGLKGGRHWMETHAIPLRDAKGRVTAQLSVTRDVSERRQAEHALRESEERLRAIFEQA